MITTRRTFLGAAAAAWARASTRPNIVLILADDLGWADLGCYGADLHETPNIDALARRSVRFTNAYSASPVCSPTRASIMTGKHPARLGMTTWLENAAAPARDQKLIPPMESGNLPLEETTVAEALRDRGYLTALVGKWHLGSAGFYPEAQGFDVNIGGTFWGAPQTHFFPYRGDKLYKGEVRYVPHLEFGKAGEYLTDRLTDEALKVVDHAGRQPFFLYLAHHAVHTPLEAKARDIERFEALLRAGMRHQNAVYAAMTWSLDESVGRVMTGLRARGLEENTIVIFASDNGGAVQTFGGRPITNNAPLRSGKGSLYEGGIRVPLMISWPGFGQRGGTCGEPVISTDLFATICEMAGASAATGVDSLSLAPLLKDPSGKLKRDQLCFHYPHYYPTTTPVSAIRGGDWKLVEYFEDGRRELFNLAEDLGEERNVAEEYPGQVAELGARLKAWREEVRAPMPERNPAR